MKPPHFINHVKINLRVYSHRLSRRDDISFGERLRCGSRSDAPISRATEDGEQGFTPNFTKMGASDLAEKKTQ